MERRKSFLVLAGPRLKTSSTMYIYLMVSFIWWSRYRCVVPGQDSTRSASHAQRVLSNVSGALSTSMPRVGYD